MFSGLAVIVEKFIIARGVFIRSTDIYLDELLETTFRFTNFAIFLKLIVSLLLYSTLEG